MCPTPRIITLCVFMTLVTTAGLASADGGSVRNSVVKVYSTQQHPNLSTPWKRSAVKNATGSGVLLSPDRLLTNYHVVAFSTDTSISLNGQSDRLSATVQAVSPGLDLAVVKLDEPLSDDATVATVAESVPLPGAKIQVLGYPKGGESLSVTEGVVSRIEYVNYRQHVKGLRVQLDAPLNSGNSGGPVVEGDKVVGLSFGMLSDANDIGYAIPCTEIRRFLDDIEDGQFDGKPQLWCDFVTLNDKEMRKWLKLPEGETGIRFVRQPIPIPNYPLKLNDVVARIGEFDVSNLGKVDYNENIQVSFEYAVDQSAKDGHIEMRIFRAGTEMHIQVPVFEDGRFLLQHLNDRPPSYFVYGPIVFGVANAEFPNALESMMLRNKRSAIPALAMLKSLQAFESPYLRRRFDRTQVPDEHLVVITDLIANSLTRDIRLLQPSVVRTINGQAVTSIQSAAKILKSIDDEQIVIEIDDNQNTTVVFDRSELESQHDQIMADNGIVNAASEDLREVWSR